jgi:hypothetical protein
MNRSWDSLAAFTNQGVELKHTFGKRAFKRTGAGGCFGRKKQPKKTKETPQDANPKLIVLLLALVAALVYTFLE